MPVLATIAAVGIEAFVVVIGCVGIVGPGVVIERIRDWFTVWVAGQLDSDLESIIFGSLLGALVAFAYLKI